MTSTNKKVQRRSLTAEHRLALNKVSKVLKKMKDMSERADKMSENVRE